MKRTHIVCGLVPLLSGVLACSGEVGSPSGFMVPADPSSGGPGIGEPAGTGSDAPAVGPGGSSSGQPGVGEPGPDGAGLGETPSPTIADAIANAEPLPMVLDGAPLHTRMMRLTHEQWENSVRYILQMGDTGQQQNLAGDVSGVHDFSNHEELLFMNANLYRDYQMAAEELAAFVGTDEGALSAVHPGQEARSFIETVGRRAYRRPLTEEEIASLQAIYDQGAELTENGGTPHARGSALVLQALLQSPNFLYRTELAQPNVRLSGYELAAKLSLLLRNVTPDDELLDAAARGELDTEQGVRNIAAQMLEEPSASDVMSQFHGELFKFDNYLQIVKDEQDVPDYSPELNEELEEAAYRFFERIYGESLGLAEILTTTVGFAGPLMAELYGLSGSAFGMQQYDLGPERTGFFTHLPFLIYNSQNLLPDPIHRGVTLNLKVLCSEIPLPGNVDTTLPAFEPDQTNRERINAGSGPGTCGAACHAPYINPLGFAFENFDGLGRVRTTDNGQPVDTASQYPFEEGTLAFSGAPELMQIMAEGEQAHACYSKHLATFALQRDLAASDRGLVDALAAESMGGASVKDLLLALVADPAFSTRAAGGAL